MMGLVKLRSFKWIRIFLPPFIVFVLILVFQIKRESLGIDAKGIQSIIISTQPNVLGDNYFAIEDNKDINFIVKKFKLYCLLPNK